MKAIETPLTTAQGTELFSRVWEPEGTAKGVIALVHGLGEHCGRYEHVAQRLTDAGYAVVAIDLPGHGRTPGTRGHLPMSAGLAAVEAELADATHRHPGVPVFLYGHSLGGLIVLTYLLKRRPAVRGAVVTSPGLKSPVLEQKLKMTAAKVLGTVAPTVVMPSGLDDTGISRDPAVIEAYRADPLVHDKASLALGKDGAEGADWVLAHAGDLAVPVLLLHGGADPITYARGSEAFAAGAPKDKVTLKIYPGLFHELHNEPEKDEVFSDIVAWLDQQTSKES